MLNGFAKFIPHDPHMEDNEMRPVPEVGDLNKYFKCFIMSHEVVTTLTDYGFDYPLNSKMLAANAKWDPENYEVSFHDH